MFELTGMNLAQAAAAVTRGETDQTANLANISALINMFIPRINWAGFYLYDGKELVLGPFQGKVACVRIPMGRGVCGAAAARRETIVVDDVHAFPGHIACDSASRSEIVIPIIKNGALIGVLDVDSPEAARFTQEDKEILESVAAIISEFTPNAP